MPRVRHRVQQERLRRWLRTGGWLAMGMAMAIAHEQALAAASTSLPKNEEELKTRITAWLLSHGLVGGVILLVVVVALALLSQAQNIEAAKRLLGLERKPEPRQPFDDFRPLPAPLPPPSPPLDPSLVPSGTGWLSNLPPPRAEFVARQLELRQLDADLAPEAARVVIHGLPGVGKTTLALHYARSASRSYPGGVWWLEASQGFAPMALKAATELEARIPGLGTGQGLELEARLRRCFQEWPGDQGEAVLLVVDNLSAPPEGLDVMRRLTTGLPGRFRCLLTQRAAAEGTGTLRLPVLASAEALELLATRSGERGRQRIAQEAEEARALVEAVGRLPLAVVLLGGRLRRLPTLRVSELRMDLIQSALEAKAFSATNAAFLGERGLVETLLGSWRGLGAEALELTKLLSLTLPAPIPWELIQRCTPPANGSSADVDWQEAVAELVGANWLESLGEERVLFVLHPLLRQFFAIQWRVRERQPRWWEIFPKRRRGWQGEPEWRRQLATAARALAEEWQGKDLSIAVAYWRQAAHAEPTDIWAAFGLGTGLIPLGDSQGARQAFEQSRRNAEAARDPRGVSCAHDGIGDVLESQGDVPGALAAYQAGLTIRAALAKRDPANTQWQRDLSVSHERMGDVLLRQENYPEALAAYQSGLTIRDNLLKRDPANTQWQHDLSISNNKIGDVLGSQGDVPGALAAYKAGLTIREALAKHDSANTQWQRDLSVSHERIGDVLVAQGDGPGAMAAYQAGLTIAEHLAKRDPANTEWQHDLLASKIRIGEMLVSQGDAPGALAAYQAGLTIAEDLAQRDPANTEWQHDLSISHNRIGNVRLSQGDGPGALAAFQAALAIREGLAKRDPENTQWQVDVAVSYGKLGTLKSFLPVATRREFLKRGLKIIQTLKDSGRLHSNQDSTDFFKHHFSELDSTG